MTTSYKFKAFEPVQAHKAHTAAWLWMKSMLAAGHRLTCEIKPEKRSNDQNAKFHAICSDIAKSGMKWAGKPRTAQQWKVLLVSGHAVATKEDSEIVPGLENEFVSIRESTALMSIKRGASLITYTIAFCAMNDIKIKETFYDPETGEIYE
jgi:hypothetical protein